MWISKTFLPLRECKPCVTSVIAPAHKIKLDAVQDGRTSMHVSALVNDVTHRKWFLSQPLPNSGSFSKHRVAVNQRHHAFAVKEFFLANAELHHKHLTTRQALLHESTTLLQAHSPLAFVETLEEGDRVYCFMPLLDGDLYDIVVSPAWTHQQAMRLCLQVMAQIGRQLDHAHHYDIVHEDVKLENILWRKNGKLLLADYGAARNLLHGAQNTSTLLTTQYAAPERLNKQPSGVEADVWSLGMVLLQILTRGKNPLALHAPDQTTAAENWDMKRAMRRKQRVFANWQQFSSREPYVQKFQLQFKLDNPKVSDFILRKMLHSDPAQRVSALDVAHFADGLLHVGARLRLRPFLRRAGNATAASKTRARTLVALNFAADRDARSPSGTTTPK